MQRVACRPCPGCHDIGWSDRDLDGLLDDEDCEVFSDKRGTIVIGGLDMAVPNHAFGNGCTIADLVAQACSSARNHGGFVSALASLTNEWKKRGLRTGAQKAPSSRQGRAATGAA